MAVRRVNNSKTFQVFTHLPSNMGRRAEEVRAVGAYVEPATSDVNEFYAAVHSATAEDRRIREVQEEKERKLKKFQDEVKLRVQKLEKHKHQQQLLKSYQAVEQERNVVRQTAFAAEIHTSRRNHLSARSEHLNHSIKGRGKDKDGDDDDSNARVLAEQAQQLKEVSRHARKKLTSRKVAGERRNDLPGGSWSAKQVGPSIHPLHVDEDDDDALQSADKENDQDITEVKTVRFEEDEPHVQDEEPEDFHEEEYEHRRKKKSKKKALLSELSVQPPTLHPGQESEEEKLRVQRQRAMYRRLFMDIEREQAKETVRRKQHQQNIARLKREKEQERRRVEQACERLIAPTDPLTGETAEETAHRKAIEEDLLQRSREEIHRRRSKAKEQNRFVEALKASLRERVAGRDLPALCCCGTSLWDTNPDTCANNCVFYKNPKAYEKALQSLLASCDVNI